jgi:hypothetical protein
MCMSMIIMIHNFISFNATLNKEDFYHQSVSFFALFVLFSHYSVGIVTIASCTAFFIVCERLLLFACELFHTHLN